MQRTRKTIVACLSLLLAILAVQIATLPRANAFLARTPTVTISGLGVSRFTDPLTNSLEDGIAAGSTLTVTAYLVASSGSSNTNYQRNVTVGFKGDWMSAYQNASNASPTTTLAMTAGTVATVTISVTMPSTGGITAHSWSVAVWDGAANSIDSAACFQNNTPEKTVSCDLIPGGSAGYDSLAVLTPDQMSAAQANVQANSVITTVQNNMPLITGGIHPTPPGATAATGQLAQAQAEISLGGQAWRNSDYGGAKTHYQNALNDANAAASDLTSQGGGVDTANLANLILGGTGIALIGIGALFAGIGALTYLRRKPKA